MKSRLTCLVLVTALAGASAISQEAAPPNGKVSEGKDFLEAYQEALKENLDLRAIIADLTEDVEEATKKRKRLTGTIKDLEKQIIQAAGVIKNLQNEAAKTRDPDKIVALETKLAEQERAKSRLNAELITLRQRVEDMAKPETQPPERPQMKVQPGSDLFRKLEQENAALRAELRDIQTQRQQAVREGDGLRETLDQKDSMIADLEDVTSLREEDRGKLYLLVKHIRKMEKEIQGLEKTIDKKDSAIQKEESRVESLERQVAQERTKFQKVKKVALLFDRIDQERKVQRLPDTEKKALYRSTADSLYRKGEFKLAEREYLKALELDPADADVHYNLAVLYDDELNNKSKAISHYTAYVELRPAANDINEVKFWLRDLEASVAEKQESEFTKDERIAFLLDQVKAPSLDAGVVESRDHHCSMAELLAKQEKYKEAVKEYKEALALDPGHADVHYNLGIIYDDELDDKERAAHHYRTYLQLRPRAEDYDQVKSWLMDAEMGS
ncbi:MAG: tetratricopeptide repeat protein [Kiritimatiellia bacterium]|nr:tetratricopeptide repeat protein [Kiritimatiellia bacterium]